MYQNSPRVSSRFFFPKFFEGFLEQILSITPCPRAQPFRISSLALSPHRTSVMRYRSFGDCETFGIYAGRTRPGSRWNMIPRTVTGNCLHVFSAVCLVHSSSPLPPFHYLLHLFCSSSPFVSPVCFTSSFFSSSCSFRFASSLLLLALHNLPHLPFSFLPFISTICFISPFSPLPASSQFLRLFFISSSSISYLSFVPSLPVLSFLSAFLPLVQKHNTFT